MHSITSRGALLLSSLVFAISSAAAQLGPTVVLPAAFTPPPVFKNTNLLRTIDLTKPYSREVTAIVVENVSDEPQSDYFVPFARDVVDRVSYVEARDKKGLLGTFEVSRVQFDAASSTQYFRVRMPSGLAPSTQVTLQLAIGTTGVLEPVPAAIAQNDKQFLRWTGTQFAASAYVTEKQKTRLRLPTHEAPDFTALPPHADGTSDPAQQGSTFTYGPYHAIEPSQRGGRSVAIRYEYTQPVIRVDRFSREIEVSHWGGNIAFEEKYAMANAGARLKDHFSRVKWAATSYYSPPTAAIQALTYNLPVGACDPYFTDEIGNVSTSRWRKSVRESRLELKPRYPIFGGWNYSYTVGWNHDLGEYLRHKPNGEDFVLVVPFLEGPREPIVYGEVSIIVILPEGATDVRYSVPFQIVKEERYLHKTFMDTIGRTAVKLTLSNVVDEQQKQPLIVSYHLPKLAIFHKPFVIFTALSALFLFSWVLRKIDTTIGK